MKDVVTCHLTRQRQPLSTLSTSTNACGYNICIVLISAIILPSICPLVPIMYSIEPSLTAPKPFLLCCVGDIQIQPVCMKPRAYARGQQSVGLISGCVDE